MSDEDVILNSYSTFAGQINSRLHSHNHARAKFFFTTGLSQRGQFMDLATNSMPKPVAELLPESGLFNHISRDSVRLQSGNPGPQKRDRRLLGFQHHIVDIFDLRAYSPEHDHPGQVAAIAF